MYDQGKEQTVPALAHLMFYFYFLNNTCHLIVLSLSYLHRYSRVPRSSPAGTCLAFLGFFCFVFFFLMCYHIFFLKNYIYNHIAPFPQLPAAGGEGRVNTVRITCLNYLCFLKVYAVSHPYSSKYFFSLNK